MNQLKYYVLRLLAAGAFVVASALAGCVAEDMGDCPPEVDCRFTFNYTDQSGRSDVARYVGAIDVYVFDAVSGVLTRIIEAGGEDIARGWIDIVDMPGGTYTFAAWGSSHGDSSRSFTASHMDDAVEHLHGEIKVGRTTLDDFYMMLGYDTLPAGSEAGIVPARADFDDLFWAIARNIQVTDRANRIIPFDFIRNTNILEIVVTGLEHLPTPGGVTRAADAPLRIFATGSNGRYRWDNTIDEWARTVHYEQPAHTLTDNNMGVDIKTMRLDVDRHDADDPMLLHLRDAAGDPITDPIDILQKIMATRSPETERLLYPDQAAIDLEYEFRININIEPLPSVPVTGIEIVPDSLTIEVGTQAGLEAIVSPADASDRRLVWTSSDPTIATVDQWGHVTGLRPGVVIITVSTPDGSHTATCVVTVIPNDPGTPDPDPDPDPGQDWEGTHGIKVTITVGDWQGEEVQPIIE